MFIAKPKKFFYLYLDWPLIRLEDAVEQLQVLQVPVLFHMRGNSIPSVLLCRTSWHGMVQELKRPANFSICSHLPAQLGSSFHLLHSTLTTIFLSASLHLFLFTPHLVRVDMSEGLLGPAQCNPLSMDQYCAVPYVTSISRWYCELKELDVLVRLVTPFVLLGWFHCQGDAASWQEWNGSFAPLLGPDAPHWCRCGHLELHRSRVCWHAWPRGGQYSPSSVHAGTLKVVEEHGCPVHCFK